MLRALLDQALLTCPCCRGEREGGFQNAPLALETVLVEQNNRILQGFLRCTACGVRHPILDGVAVIFRDTGAWLRQQERAAMWRDDLAPPLEHWVRGAWAEDEDPNWHRQMLAIYGRALAPDEAPCAAELHYEARRRALIGGMRAPLVLDAGCGLGQATLSVAALGARVLAMDSDMGALRALSRMLTHGRATLPRWRHGGGDFVPCELHLSKDVDPNRVALVATDLLDPPLAARSLDLALAYHVLDNVSSPVKLVRQLHAALRVGGVLALASPYDWSPRATPIAERLGESLRAGDDPDPAAALRALLRGELPTLAPELAMEITGEELALPWVLARHARSFHGYLAHYVEATRTG